MVGKYGGLQGSQNPVRVEACRTSGVSGVEDGKKSLYILRRLSMHLLPEYWTYTRQCKRETTLKMDQNQKVTG